MKTIRNKKTGEILQVSEGDLAKYGLGGQTHSSKGKKVLRSFQQGGIRDYLFSKGVDGSKANRTKLFNKYFDGKYTGTAEQNIKLLSDIKSGKIKINGDINPWVNTGAKADIKKQASIKTNPWGNIGEKAIVPTTKPNVTNTQRASIGAVGATATKLLPDTNIPPVIKETSKIANGASSNLVKRLLSNNTSPSIGQKVQNSILSQVTAKLKGKIKDIPEEMLPGLKISSGIAANAGNFIKNNTENNIESGVLFDKATGKGYFLNNKKAEEPFNILSGENPYVDISDYSKYPSQYSERVTPTGKFVFSDNMKNLSPKGVGYKTGLLRALYPISGKIPNAKIQFAMHEMADPAVRNRLLGTRNPWASAGCINCTPDDMKKIITRFPKGDSVEVVNSFKPEGLARLQAYGIKKNRGYFQPGGYTDKTGSHFNLQNFFNQNTQTSLNDCPIGYKWSVADQQCLPDEQAVASNFSGDRNKFITGTINQNGEKVGGTNAQPTMSHQPNASNNNYINNSDMNLKRVFGTPNIPAILASNLLLSGLSAFGNNVEEGRQKASAMNQMNNPAFNQTYSYAQPDYGADPYEQTGQKRKTIFKIGGKFRELQGGGGFNAYDFLYGDDEDTTQKKSNDTTKNKKRVTESEVDDSQAQLEAIGLSDMDILNMPSPIRRNISSEEYSPDSSSNYSSQGSNNYGELYLQHQQGATGIRLIKQAAEQGLDVVPRSWNKENIQSNMRNNVSKDFKGPVTPAKFLEYWNGKINRHMAKVANKETPYDSIFQKVGQEEGINPIFLKAVANIESGINPNNNTKSKYKGITALNYNTYGKKVFDPYFSLSTTAKSFKQEGGTYSIEDISKLPSNFAVGGTFELNESDIQKLIKQGYKIDRL